MPIAVRRSVSVLHTKRWQIKKSKVLLASPQPIEIPSKAPIDGYVRRALTVLQTMMDSLRIPVAVKILQKGSTNTNKSNKQRATTNFMTNLACRTGYHLPLCVPLPVSHFFSSSRLISCLFFLSFVFLRDAFVATHSSDHIHTSSISLTPVLLYVLFRP